MWPHRRQPTRLCCPWDSPGKNTGVGCYFLLQCMKVKSESEVAQSWLTLRDPTDWSLSGSSVHGIFQARVLEWGAIAFSKADCKPMKRLVYLELVFIWRVWSFRFSTQRKLDLSNLYSWQASVFNFCVCIPGTITKRVAQLCSYFPRLSTINVWGR